LVTAKRAEAHQNYYNKFAAQFFIPITGDHRFLWTMEFQA